MKARQPRLHGEALQRATVAGCRDQDWLYE
jgi:hypothetical protein